MAKMQPDGNGCSSGQILFAPDSTAARRDDGIQKSPSHPGRRRLLAEQPRPRPGQVFSRDQLLDAVAEVGSDSRDRSIDFLINRLRRQAGRQRPGPPR